MWNGWVVAAMLLVGCGGGGSENVGGEGEGEGEGEEPVPFVATDLEACPVPFDVPVQDILDMAACELGDGGPNPANIGTPGSGLAFAGCLGLAHAAGELVFAVENGGVSMACTQAVEPAEAIWDACDVLGQQADSVMKCATESGFAGLWPEDPYSYECPCPDITIEELEDEAAREAYNERNAECIASH